MGLESINKASAATQSVQTTAPVTTNVQAAAHRQQIIQRHRQYSFRLDRTVHLLKVRKAKQPLQMSKTSAKC